MLKHHLLLAGIIWYALPLLHMQSLILIGQVDNLISSRAYARYRYHVVCFISLGYVDIKFCVLFAVSLLGCSGLLLAHSAAAGPDLANI